MLNELAKEVHEIAKSKGWWDKGPTFGDVIANIHCELSEAFEDYRNGRHINETYVAGLSAGKVFLFL